MMVVWNGAPSLHLNDLSAGAIVGAIFGVMGVTLLLSILFFYPFLYRKLVMEDWKLRWYHVFVGPMLWRRGPVPWCPEEQRIVVQNYYRGHLTKEELEARDASLRLYREATELGDTMSPKLPSTSTPSSTSNTPPTISEEPELEVHELNIPVGSKENGSPSTTLTDSTVKSSTTITQSVTFPPQSRRASTVPSSFSNPPDQSRRASAVPSSSNRNDSRRVSTTASTVPSEFDSSLVSFFKYTAWPQLKQWILHGVDQDIVHLQQRDSRVSRTRRLEKMHARAARYDNQTEHLFSFLQVLTASTQSFAHGYNSPRLGLLGANDIGQMTWPTPSAPSPQSSSSGKQTR